MQRAALYIRVSTDEQARHGLSLGEQRADLINYAEKHGYIIVDIYADEGNTARKKLSSRKELQRLLDDVRAGKIDIIIFKCLDRWFRNIRDYYAVQNVLDEYRVEWECTQEKYNTTTTNGRLMLNLKLSIAQNESDMTSDRIKYINAGKLKRKEVLTAKHPYGYKIIDKHLVVVPEEAAVVRFVYNHVLSGNSIRSAAQAVMDEFGISLQQKRCWRMLRNEIYAGRHLGIEDFCEPIISPALFARLQEKIGKNQRPAKGNSVYLFSGKLACPYCGNILMARKMYPYKEGNAVPPPVYFCGKKQVTGAPGECYYGGVINEAKLEKYLVEKIQPLLQEYVAKLEQAAKQTHADYPARIQAVEKKLTRLKELYLDELIDKETYRTDYDNFRQQIDSYTRAMHTTVQVPQHIRDLLQLEDFAAMYTNLDKPARKALWQRLIRQIKIEPTPRPGSQLKRPKYQYKFIVLFF